MPVKACQINGKPWYKRWDDGACYPYEMWDKDSRETARSKAMEQWKAIEVNKVNTTIDVDTTRIVKTEVSSFNTVLFVALVPFDVDRNGDIITDVEITKTAHDFVIHLSKKKVNVDHQENTDITTAEFVESFIAPVEIPVGLEVIPKWAWIVGIRFDDDTYKAIQDGEFVGISIEWKGIREEIMRS